SNEVPACFPQNDRDLRRFPGECRSVRRFREGRGRAFLTQQEMKMFTARTLSRSLLQTVAASAIITSAFVSSAAAGTQVSISGDGFSNTPIRVTSEDGKTWSKIEDRSLSLPLKVAAGKTDYTVHNYAARQLKQKFGNYLFHDTYNAQTSPIRLDFA